MTRDEFGGYCCKRWGTEVAKGSKKGPVAKNQTLAGSKRVREEPSEDNICELLGLDINKTALEIVKADFKRKKIPFSK